MRQWGIPASRGPNLRLRFRMVENLATRKKKILTIYSLPLGEKLWAGPRFVGCADARASIDARDRSAFGGAKIGGMRVGPRIYRWKGLSPHF